jgi:hypothetical protein
MRDRFKTFERTVTGQVVISIGLLVAVGAIVIGNLPDSGLKATLGAATIIGDTLRRPSWMICASMRSRASWRLPTSPV